MEVLVDGDISVVWSVAEGFSELLIGQSLNRHYPAPFVRGCNAQSAGQRERLPSVEAL